MSDDTKTLPARLDDYDAIAAAVMETARGRWFLAEYARRHRAADTAEVLDAIGKLEKVMGAARPAPEIDRIRMDIREMAGAIARTKTEIAAIKPEGVEGGRFEEASVELDAIVQATATATGDILSAAETIQEIAWTLREMGAEGEVCDLIDTKATDIYAACSFQDVTGQRTRKVIGVLRFLEDRIDSMMGIWGDAGVAAAPLPAKAGEPSLLNGPARPGEGLAQDDVDLMMDDGLFEQPAAALAVRPATSSVVRPAASSVVQAAPSVAAAPVAPHDVPVAARATAAAALSTADTPLAPSPRPARAGAGTGGKAPEGLPSIEDIEKLSFVEKVAVMS
ncbi:protein phosphatase CheZ [Phreatobacter stygius]|uniref:Protein phosphatase CheZ n=1 Tax=Phreatobacter stygius TaxID=1940610 RepID=A0A4D7APE6_9HYPH|nr:protein phosphatase CheZ [Phreatobacter stygius]QCI63054.1 protein phosphatase CheZ [Phreatobacter stygius]